jgi:glycerophosphoryl diester phosphodiesterase
MLTRLLFTMILAAASPLSAVDLVAHRGFSARAPENTVAAFQLAWRSGADACELDLHLTADGGIAVLHDKDTQRTTGAALVAAATPLADLRRLDAGSWKAPDFAGERIPNLAEALATLPADRGRFLLEIKCGPEVVPELARQLEAWKPRAHQLCIIAFDRAAAREAKKALPWVKVFRLSSEQTRDKKPVDLDALIADTVADGLDGLDLSQKWAWNEAFVRRVRAAGLEVHVWTVNKPEDVRRLAALGVDSITTDDPVMAREALSR